MQIHTHKTSKNYNFHQNDRILKLLTLCGSFNTFLKQELPIACVSRDYAKQQMFLFIEIFGYSYPQKRPKQRTNCEKQSIVESNVE